MTALKAGGATDVGLVRANNQDQLLVADPLFAVADGMGGHAAGEVASQTALDAFHHAFAATDRITAETLSEAVRMANRAVWDAAEASSELRGMGTTLTGVALVASETAEELAVVNVGDSRTYRLSDGTFEQLTADHSLVAELVAEGQIDSDEAEVHPQRHVLTRALGVSPDVDVDLLTFEPRVGDRYLLCSDGLSREVTDAQVAAVLRRLADPGDAARELVAQARAHGGNDNITVVVVDVVTRADPIAEDDPPTLVAPALAGAALVDGGSTGPASPGGNGAGGAGSVGNEGGAGDHSGAGAAAGEPAPDTAGAGRPSRRERRRAAKAAGDPKARLITVRVVGFFVLALAILGAAFAGAAWYARESYFVSVRGDHITIFQGRPGGVLWWQPTIAEDTALTIGGVESHNLPALHAGVLETSLGSARRYVANLKAEKVAATPPATTATTTTTTTTIPTTTTVTRPRTTTTVRTRHHRTRTAKKASR